MKKIQIPPALGVLFGILAVSTASPLIRFAQREGGSLVIAALRVSMATIILTPFALAHHRDELRSLGRRSLAVLVLSGFFLAVHFAAWVTSLEYTTVASSVVLVSTAPLWVAILSAVVLKERLPRGIWLGLAVALIGGILVGMSQSCSLAPGGLRCDGFTSALQGQAMLGNLLALMGAWTVAGYLIIGRKYRARLSLVAYTFCVYGSAALFLLAGVVIRGDSLRGYSPEFYLLCLSLAVVPQLLGHSTFNWALRYLSATYVSITQLGEPIVSAILAYFLLTETPSAMEVFGAALILTGIYLSARIEQRRNNNL